MSATSPARTALVVLDTNVISEFMRPAPDAGVVAWVSRLPPAALCTTAVTVAEVRFGIARLSGGRRRILLTDTADEVFSAFADRVLPFDASAAGYYADIVVERDRAGAPLSGFDAQIAAICKARFASLATRNTSDFSRLGLHLIDPWTTDA